MAKAKDRFLEQLQRRKEAATSSPSTTAEKPIEQMSGEELDEALDQARRDLLDAQRQELREREQARLQKPASGEEAGPRTLSDVLREAKQARNRRR